MGGNWKRGLFRLWLIASVVWIVGIIGYMFHSGMQETESKIQLFCFLSAQPPIEGIHECTRRMYTFEGYLLHDFEQRGPPNSSAELATWEIRRQLLRADMVESEANRNTPFWQSLRHNWYILPLGSVLIFLIGAGGVASVKVIAWVVRGFA
jgi:hypothetical protein